MPDRLRSHSVGSQGRIENLSTSSLSGSETSILMQAMSRAKLLEEEEKSERIGKGSEIFLHCKFAVIK